MKLTKKNAYGVLFISIAFELLGTGCLEACEGFSRALPTVIMIFAYTASFWTYSKVLRFVNLSIAYATWTAVGTICSALMGVFLFSQPLSAAGWAAIAGMVIGVFLLNLFGTPKAEEAAGEEDAK